MNSIDLERHSRHNERLRAPGLPWPFYRPMYDTCGLIGAAVNVVVFASVRVPVLVQVDLATAQEPA